MTGTDDLVVRGAVEADVAAVSDLHRVAFPDYQSSDLGPMFTRRLLGEYLARPEVVFLVALGPSAPAVPVGYLVGCPPAIQRRVNDAMVPWAALAAVGRAVQSPVEAVAGARSAAARARSALGSLARRLRPLQDGGGTSVGVGEHGGDAEPSAPAAGTRVVLVAVDPAGRGSGVADALLTRFAERAAAQGHRRADLVVAEDNTTAHRCYERNGWVRAVADAPAGGPGPRSVRYTLDLAPREGSGNGSGCQGAGT